ncbi:MAG: M48 family metalloprotease [Fimbriimonadaceae bacterium]
MTEKGSEFAKREEFIAKVKAFEAQSKADPGKYVATCKSLVNLGYLYIVFTILVIVAMIAALVWFTIGTGSINSLTIKLVLVLGFGIFAMIRAIFTRIPEPNDGVDVSRAEAPKLWAEVDAMAKSLGAPPIHQIRITYDWNASASQTPRFGIVGPCHNTLRYGLPLMLAETHDEARSTIAHELGHFAGGHSKFAGKVYRIVEVWQAAAAGMSGFMAKMLFGPFIKWYLPKLWATTFPLRRQDEYEADAAATRLAGAEANALSLVRLGTQSKAASKAVGKVYELVETTPVPPANVVQITLTDLIANIPSIAQFSENLEESLKEETGYDDTHPSLRDRLNAIDAKFEDKSCIEAQFSPIVCAAPVQSAAQVFFGSNLPMISENLNRHWAIQVSQVWAQRHRIVSPKAKEIREAEAAGLDTIEDARLSALLSESLNIRGAQRSEAMGREMLRRNPEHAQANLLLGSLLADKLNPEAMTYLDLAAKDINFRADAYAISSYVAEKLGDKAKAAQLYDLSADLGETEQKLYAEGLDVEHADLRWWRPEDDQLATWIPIFQRSNHILEVYGVRFESKIRPGKMHFLILVLPKYPAVTLDEEGPVNNAVAELADIDFTCLVLPKSNKIWKRLKKVQHHPMWARPK